MVKRPSLAGVTWGSPVFLMRVTFMHLPRLGRAQLKGQFVDAVGAQPHLDVLRRDDHLLDQDPNDALLLGREQFVPNLVQPGHADP
ncbi:MAG: hypothetical protein H0U97_08150 [Gammaproteobacteria bacterium]|nr:hypothetical protein [Gammaproteobacteria bacterium]